jgi:hypothetical protein
VSLGCFVDYLSDLIVDTREVGPSARPASEAESDSTLPVSRRRTSRFLDDNEDGPDPLPLVKRHRPSRLRVGEDDDEGTTKKAPIYSCFPLPSLSLFLYGVIF